MKLPTLAQTRKGIAALVGFVAAALAAGLVPDQYVRYAAIIISAATVLGVYGVKNAPKPEDPQP